MIKVSIPYSSTVNAESLSNVMPAPNGWPGLLKIKIKKRRRNEFNLIADGLVNPGGRES